MKLRPTWRFILRLLLITSILVIPLMATDQLRHLIMDFPVLYALLFHEQYEKVVISSIVSANW